MARRIAPETKAKYFRLREAGYSQTRAAREVAISRQTAWAWEKDLPTSWGAKLREMRMERSDVLPPIPMEELDDDARRALDDFGFFRAHFLGNWSDPWQEEAAHAVIDLLGRDSKNYEVVNCPPGSGKTTLFSHDLAAWLIARDRSIRMMLGSRTNSQAKRNTGRLKRTLEREQPVEGAARSMAQGYGRFKPDYQDLWTREEFLVEQHSGVAPDEKEATVLAAAQETGFLGGRCDFICWDDLVDRKNTRTAEMRNDLQEWYELEAETRLEPGGVFILMGQRIATSDLYRHALDMRAPEDDDDVEITTDATGVARKYHHITFQAHDDANCQGDHGKDARPQPEGCLLSPRRLSWTELAQIKENNQRRYAVTYQQEDVDPEAQLVQDIWVTGGRGDDGVEYRGCLDHERAIAQVPVFLGDALSVVTVDPSPANWWGVHWWASDSETEERYLLDLHRDKMGAPDLLDRLPGDHYVGLLEDWRIRANGLGLPIQTVIVERNAAQRFIYQYDHWRRWLAMHGIDLIPHDTHSNKVGEELGVEMIGPQWRHGRVRLPYAPGTSRRQSQRLIDEVTAWPDGATDDQVMAQWFFEYHRENLVATNAPTPTMEARPSWIKQKMTNLTKAGARA